MAGFKLSSLLLSLCIVAYAAANDCTISLSDFTVEPVILTSSDAGSSYNLFKPDNKTTTIDDGTQLLLLCSGKKNTFATVGGETLELTCNKGAFEDSTGESHQFTNLQCTAIPAADLQETEESCSDGRGLIYNAGFSYNDNQFATVFSICYDVATQKVFYTYNVINGKAIDYSIVESTRRAFKADKMGKTTSAVNKLYTTAQQIKEFQSRYGSDQTYVTKSNYIARGHLTPDADGITRYEQLATYFYMNVKPEYQNINAGNWLHVEKLARSAAASLKKDLEVYTGVIGNLEFADESGSMVKAYLDTSDLFEVPQYFFKVILDTENDAGIVMISSNNPHLENTDSNEFCAKSLCDEANMSHANFATRTDRGFTFCCSVADFAKNCNYLPENVSASKLLTIA